MPVALFTGLPGSGKTASLVKRLVDLQKKEPGRPVFAFGINGLKEGLAIPLTEDMLRCAPTRRPFDGSLYTAATLEKAREQWRYRMASEYESVSAFANLAVQMLEVRAEDFEMPAGDRRGDSVRAGFDTVGDEMVAGAM